MEKSALRNRAFGVLCGICATFGPSAGSPSSAAQIAASIEYDVVARPAGVPSDFEARDGASLKFLAIKAIDGFQVDAALWQPSR